MSLNTQYNNTMKIKRLNFPTQDEVGGIVQTNSNNIVVKCRIRQLSAQERSVAGDRS